jgi:hypothetical protein
MRVIDEIELACDLAHLATTAELIHDLPSEYPDEESLYEVDNRDYVYKPHVQDLFNNYYDYYLEMIDNCEIKQLI